MKNISQNKVAGGWLKRYTHESTTTACTMTFAIFLPPQAETGPVPLVYWLSGLTCTEENFCHKAGAFAKAAELGLAIVCPDTSPRGTDLPSEHDSWDFGSGAGFYINATQAPWADHYNMYDYVIEELPALVQAEFPVSDKCSIFGHSMGGHGALICALKNPGKYQSVSALAPISNPTECAWGFKIFNMYIGDDKEAWKEWDASLLIANAPERLPILVDQGAEDDFYKLGQLQPEKLEAAAKAANHPITLRMQDGYDHSYYFVSTFINDHLEHHAAAIKGVH